MIRNLIRTIGSACILTGTILYFIQADDPTKIGNAADQDLQNELTVLQTKLEDTQEELANLQTATLAAETSAEEGKDRGEVEVEAEPFIKTVFSIPPGTDSSTVARSLVKQGIIDNTTEFELYLAANELAGAIQIGRYPLDSSMDIETIVKLITKVK